MWPVFGEEQAQEHHELIHAFDMGMELAPGEWQWKEGPEMPFLTKEAAGLIPPELDFDSPMQMPLELSGAEPHTGHRSTPAARTRRRTGSADAEVSFHPRFFHQAAPLPSCIIRLCFSSPSLRTAFFFTNSGCW